ncbi:putative phage tape measure protein [Novosphingobium resinovorum]|uniref:Putative phage tape measure protein n=1 Tax=Novosphingobium resinovorum TaxID=158500 RepID=A0A031JP32_9SPHN|nr:tape measure protein [Novosphingobium resinovorum]EZP79531.1 putative phage tape measure protein [Novosphingobium resinovorum]
MVETAAEVRVKLVAELNDYNRRINESTRLTDQAFGKIADAQARTEAQIKQSAASISGTFKGMAGALATYFSGRELVGIIDRFTQFQNKLRVAGVAASDLGIVQDRLFASAQKYGVELGALGGLYSSLSNASKELGASQQQIFELSDTVAASLKVSGLSAGEAAGALQQLGQALRGGTIQAEEYNSLLDGLYPLLEAAAAGSDRFGGSIGTLTKLVKDGKVSSKEFFDAILAGSELIENRAQASVLTLSGAYTQLTNALTVYVGEAAQTSGAQAALAEGISKLADNLDVLIPALALLGASLGVKYVASAGAAALATIRTDAALLGLSTRAEVASFAMGRLVRSLSINAAVLALTAAIGAMGAEVLTTDGLIRQANVQYDEMRKRLETAAQVASAAGDGAKGVGDGAAGAEPKVRSFAGAVGALADQLYRQADAAKKARVEGLELKLSESQTAESELAKRTPAGRNNSQNEFRRGDFLNNAGVILRGIVGGGKSILSGGRTDKEAIDAYRKQTAVSLDLADQLRKARAAPLTDFVGTPASVAAAAGAGSGKGGKKGAGATGPSASQRREEQQRIEQEIANAQIGYLQELAQTTQNAADRALLDQQVIEATRAANEQDIKANANLNDAQRDKLLVINDQVAQLRAEQAQAQEMERLRQEQLQITTQALRDEDSLLQAQSNIADTAKERRSIELRRLDLAYRMEEAAVAEELAQAEIANDTKRIAAARKRMADIQERRGVEEQGVLRSTESPGQRYLREINKTGGQIDEDLEAISARGLESLNDGLTDAITGAKSLGEAFGNVADQIISDLLRIAIQQAIIKPLANSLFGGGSGGGLFGDIGGAIAAPLDNSIQPEACAIVGGFQRWSTAQ